MPIFRRVPSVSSFNSKFCVTQSKNKTKKFKMLHVRRSCVTVAAVATLLFCFLAVQRTEASCDDLKNVDGLLFDLDGTIYLPQGLIPGAKELYATLMQHDISFGFLSNSGAKGPEGVRAKFQTPPFVISPDPVSLTRIRTAAQGIADFMGQSIPEGSHIYLLQSTSKFGKNATDSCLKVISRTVDPNLFNSWDIRTDLTMDEAKAWAKRASDYPESTYVVTCADGEVSDDADPVTGKPGYTDWTFDLLSKATWMIQNGAGLVNHAPDTHNLIYDPKYPTTNLATPGPGTFFELLKKATYPQSDGNLVCTGKGGNMGVPFMMEPGVALLKAQRSSGNYSRIAMVGDTLDTDILAGNQAGVQTVFVLSGVHTVEDMNKYPNIKPTCILNSVADIPKYLNLGARKPHVGQQKEAENIISLRKRK